MLPLRNLIFSAVAVSILTIPAMAQPVISAKAGTIAKVEGQVYLGDQLVEESITKFPDIKENGVVRAEDGRAEILLAPGMVLHLGEKSSLKMISTRLIDTRLELLTGSAVVDVEQIGKDTTLTVVCKDSVVTLSKAGHYRFDAAPARLRVFDGLASVELGSQTTMVASGKVITLSGTSASVEKFDKNDTDSLDNWARRRGEIMAIANVSAAKSVYNRYGSVIGGGQWNWNPYFGLYTYIPGSGRFCDPFYGYCYWSPSAVNRIYYVPQPMPSGFGGGGFNGPSYTAMQGTSAGYSGTVASSSGSVSSAPAAAAASSAAASSSSAASAGHGSGASGGRGR